MTRPLIDDGERDEREDDTAPGRRTERFDGQSSSAFRKSTEAWAEGVAKALGLDGPAPLRTPPPVCEGASNGIRRKSKCHAPEAMKAAGQALCSSCIYAERECADSIRIYGWNELEWEP